MELKQTINIIQDEALNSGVRILVRDSKSSSSCYIKLFSKTNDMLIRVSDHPTYKNVVTLRFDKITNRFQVTNFIKNRIKDLCRRDFKRFLGR